MKSFLFAIVLLISFAANAGSGMEISPGPTCISHMQHIDGMVAEGMTPADIMANFEQWMAIHVEPVPHYADMVRGLIRDVGTPRWPQEAYADCVRTLQGGRI